MTFLHTITNFTQLQISHIVPGAYQDLDIVRPSTTVCNKLAALFVVIVIIVVIVVIIVLFVVNLLHCLW